MKLYRYLFLGCSIFTLLTSGCSGNNTGNEQPEVSIQLIWDDVKQPIDGFGIAQAGWADELYSHKTERKSWTKCSVLTACD